MNFCVRTQPGGSGAGVKSGGSSHPWPLAREDPEWADYFTPVRAFWQGSERIPALSAVEQEDLGCPWIRGTGLELCAEPKQHLLKAPALCSRSAPARPGRLRLRPDRFSLLRAARVPLEMDCGEAEQSRLVVRAPVSAGRAGCAAAAAAAASPGPPRPSEGFALSVDG